jgi:hypothetical protein
VQSGAIPPFFKLEQIEALKAMAESGARFVIGLDSGDLASLSLPDND